MSLPVAARSPEKSYEEVMPVHGTVHDVVILNGFRPFYKEINYYN